MAIVFSPSNLGTFKQCPRKFYGSVVTKEIKWKASQQKSRGSVMHAAMEKALRLGWQDRNPFDEKVDTAYARQVVEEVRQDIANGYKLHIEHELAMTKKGTACGWWDDDCFLRAKADVLLLHPQEELPVIIGDIKTGRIYDSDHMQLRIECLLAHILYQRPVVTYAYWYIDEGATEEGTIDFRNGLSPVQDIYDLLKEVQQAERDNYFPPQRMQFCKWCDWYKTEKCGF